MCGDACCQNNEHRYVTGHRAELATCYQEGTTKCKETVFIIGKQVLFVPTTVGFGLLKQARTSPSSAEPLTVAFHSGFLKSSSRLALANANAN